MTEHFLRFQSEQANLSAILHLPENNCEADNKGIGVLIIVGGPQYRVGSHRQFVKLSRALAKHGIASMRLDITGMGDSTGTAAPFYHQTTDIEFAVEQFFLVCPQLKSLVLWGLCDAASAILIKLNRPDPRISGIVLLNPWVRQAQNHAQVKLKYYYLQRLFKKQFWLKCFSGGLALRKSFLDLLQTIQTIRQDYPQKENNTVSFKTDEIPTITENNYVDIMLAGWQRFSGKILLISSELDLTAKEFFRLCQQDPSWKYCLQQANQQVITGANHTFSSQHWREQVEQASLDFIQRL